MSKSEISKADWNTFLRQSSCLKMLIYASGQEGGIYQLCAFPASVHSSTSSQHRADLIFTDCQQPQGASCFSSWRPARSKVAWPPAPVLMAGKEGHKLLQQLLEDSWNGAENLQLPATLVLRSALIQQTDAKLSCFGGSSSQCELLFPFSCYIWSKKWLAARQKKSPQYIFFLSKIKSIYILFIFLCVVKFLLIQGIKPAERYLKCFLNNIWGYFKGQSVFPLELHTLKEK